MKTIAAVVEELKDKKDIVFRELMESEEVARFPMTDFGRLCAIAWLFERNFQRKEVINDNILLKKNYDESPNNR